MVVKKKILMLGVYFALTGCALQGEPQRETEASSAIVMETELLTKNEIETGTVNEMETSPTETSGELKTMEASREQTENSESEDVVSENDRYSTEELRVEDTLIENHKYLSTTAFRKLDMELVWEENPNMELVAGEEEPNGWLNYWKADGIEYVTFSLESKAAAIILTDDYYSLKNGIHVGMTETELVEASPLFKKHARETWDVREATYKLFLDPLGPFQTTDYDDVYACKGHVSQIEEQKYGMAQDTCYGVSILMKNEIVQKIIISLPNAG